MNKKGLGILVMVLLGFFFIGALAHAGEKLAYVDLEKVFSEYSKTKKYDKILEKKQKDYEQAREKMVADVKSFQEQLNLLSKEEKQARRSELENKIAKLQTFDRNSTQELRKESNEKTQELVKDINQAIGDYAKEQGISFIFNKRTLLYGKDASDITDQISKIIK